MKNHGLQAMVKSIVSDEEARSRFISDPRSFIAAYRLTAVEQKAVLSTRFMDSVSSGSSTLAIDGALETWF